MGKGQGMGSHLSRGLGATVASALALLVVVALFALAACGVSGNSNPTRPTSLPTRSAPVAAVSFPADQKPESEGDSGGGSTGGLEFVPWVDIEVSALGYYDHGQDGLRNDHNVVIYDSSRAAVTSTVIVNGTSDLDGLFRYEPIEPVVLKAGRHYLLAYLSAMSGDPYADPDGVVWAPEIRFVRFQEHDDGWAYPAGTWAFMDLTGNFRFLPISAASPSPLP